MSEEKDTIEVEETVEQAEKEAVDTSDMSFVEKMMYWYEQYTQGINIGLGVLTVIVFGAIFYKGYWLPQQEAEAQVSMFQAQYYFEQDSFALALNTPNGFAYIAENYGGTDAGNLAHYYAGVCSYHLSDYQRAIDYLNDFDTDEELVGALALQVLADAQMEVGAVDNALSNYKKSANYTDNESIAPLLLLKAGMALEMQGHYEDALDYYNEISIQYPLTEQGSDIKKYIARVEAKID